jgi:UDP-glucose:(heptosyl)LPS alpha-1,3-glucosyltransferase
MRIGIDIRDADPKTPGQQRYLYRLGGWLASLGNDVRFLTVRRQPADVSIPSGTSLERVDQLSRDALLDHVRALTLDVLLLNPERSRRYRGLHANVLRAAYGTDHYSQKLRSFHSPIESGARRLVRLTPWEMAERNWERAFYEPDGAPPDVVAQSHYMKREILDTYRIPGERVHVVHNAVDTTEFAPEARLSRRAEARARWGIGDDEFCVLFLGHNFRLKGLWEILRALPAVRGRGPLRLLAVGRGTGAVQRAQAQRHVERLGLSYRVVLAGAVPAIEAYAAADALLHLTWHDSFGFVVLEGMACGLPVVTTAYAGASELIDDGVSGIVIDPASHEALVASISSLADAATRERIGNAAAAAARGHNEPVNFRAVLGVLQQAAARSTGPVR